MKALKNHSTFLRSRGFTLIEVMIALTVTGLGLTPLFLSQGRLIKQTGRDFAEWESMIALKNFMYTTAQKQASNEKEQKTVTQEINGVTVSYDTFKPAKNSSLQTIEHIELIKATAEWDFFGQDSITFVNAQVVPPEPTEKEGDTSDVKNKQQEAKP